MDINSFFQLCILNIKSFHNCLEIFRLFLLSEFTSNYYSDKKQERTFTVSIEGILK